MTTEMLLGANPIRKVVTLMQNMQKEIEAEGAKEKELFEKFMCFCSDSGGGLQAEIATGKAKIEELSAKVKSEEAEKVQLIQEVADHKTDREQAKADLAEATTLREKEKSEYDALAADTRANIEGLAQAIPAIEKGMSGASFLQTANGNRMLKLVQSFPDMDPMDRRNLMSFLEDKDGAYASAGGAGEILGIMKQMKDTMEANEKEATADEEKAVAGFADLQTSKEKEIEVATESIESKTVRSGELAVSIVEAKDSLEDTTQEVADNEKFASSLTEQCASKEKEWAQRQKDRAAEISAVSEAIGILNDDDALDVFKKAIPSASLAQQEVGLLQQSSTVASPPKRAQAILETLAGRKGMPHSRELGLMLYALSSKLRLAHKGKVQNFGEIIKTIDGMVALLGKEQKDDDKQKGWCQGELDKATDEETAAKEKLAQIEAMIAEMTDGITALGEEVTTLQESIKALDKAVAQATEQRKEEHEEYLSAAQMSQAAVQLVGKAKNRMNKFYNPSMAEIQTQSAPGFLQIRAHRARRDLFSFAEDDQQDQPEAPETFSGEVKKNEKSAGVIGMMDMIIRDLENDMKDAEYEEKTAQEDYAKLMSDSETSRQQDSKGVVDKSAAKADMEGKLVTAKNDQAGAAEEVRIVETSISDLHGSCDFLLQNYDLRKEARGNEIEALKNAKAMLSGANFGF
jgi:chromosome segregation ATPase